MPIANVPVGDLSARSYITATRLVNEIPPALSFLDPLLFGSGAEQRVLSTEDFEIVVVDDDKTMSPMIQPGTRPPSAPGISHTIKHVSTPMIADARNMPVAQMLLERRPGVSHYHSPQASAAQRQHMVEEFAKLTRRVDNRKEWMAGQMLDHALTYDSSGTAGTAGQGTDSVSIDYGADDRATLTVATGWDDLQFTTTQAPGDSPAGPGDADGGILRDSSVYESDPNWTFQLVGRIMNELVRVQPTHCIMGTEAAAAFMTHPAVKAQLRNTNYEVGQLAQLANNMDLNGARRLGTYQGIECWEYAGQLTGDDGTATALIGSKKAYFIHVGPQAEFQKVYGLIPNWKLTFGSVAPRTMEQITRLRAVAARAFGDVVADEYGNSIEGLMYTRPLPVLRRPNVIVGVTVVTSTFGTDVLTSYDPEADVVPPQFTDAGSSTYQFSDLV